MTTHIHIGIGLNDHHRIQAAQLYYTAFRQKLHPIFRDEARAIAVLEQSLNGSHALVATVNGDFAGIAGFKDAEGSLTDLQPHRMTDAFGFFGGWWRLLALSLFERSLEPDTLLMDGIVVAPEMRGMGIGSKLLDATIEHAHQRGCTSVRLDVVDTNPRARQLYERKGFIATKTERYPIFRHIFGFAGSTTMLKTI